MRAARRAPPHAPQSAKLQVLHFSGKEPPLHAGQGGSPAPDRSVPSYLVLPTCCAINGSVQLGMARGPHRAPQRVADALQKTHWRRTRLLHSLTRRYRFNSQGRGRPVQSPRHQNPLGAARVRATLGETTAYVHVVTEGGVGTVLQATLMAHVVEDARGHQGEVQHLAGRGVIQAQPPAPAERETSGQRHCLPAAGGPWAPLRQLLAEEPNISLESLPNILTFIS